MKELKKDNNSFGSNKMYMKIKEKRGELDDI